MRLQNCNHLHGRRQEGAGYLKPSYFAAFGGLCLKRSIDSEVHAHPTSPKTNGLQKHVICILKEMWCTSLSLPRNTGPGGKGERHDENNGSPLHGPLMQPSRRNVTVLKLCHIYFFCQYLFQNRWPSGEDEEHGAPARCFSLGCRISGAARLFGPLIREGRRLSGKKRRQPCVRSAAASG